MSTRAQVSPEVEALDVEDRPTAASRPSNARSRELGAELRRIRRRAGMSPADTAEALGWSLGKLNKLETGSRRTSPWEIAVLLGRIGADKATRHRIQTIIDQPDTGTFLRPHHQAPDTLTALTVHERLARTITAYEPLTIPSLAQTEDYAHALTGDRALARARTARQDRLRHHGQGPDTTLYVHEAALRMVVGDPAIMRDQLLHLTLMCGRPDFTPRVIPMSAPLHTATRSPATLLTFDPPLTPLAYTETDTAMVFHDDPDTVTHHHAKMRHLAALALPVTPSHDVLARWADRYDHRTN
ncbi:MAG: helix-turn-helix domain-containing protein [Saccharothrix sp.]|nr:helix-turn-helix domain-containing protein [Saccharothrix sp.]